MLNLLIFAILILTVITKLLPNYLAGHLLYVDRGPRVYGLALPSALFAYVMREKSRTEGLSGLSEARET